jgi:nucleoside-diphosphate-sugar epimerase
LKVSNKKIFITGGAGYAGSRYVPLLLESNNFVTVYDNFYFGDFIPNHKNLKKIKSDIRDISFLEKSCEDHEIFIHLACISNDTSFELDEKLSTEINFECFEKIVIASKKSKIKRFIYASTSSVYGISNQKDIKEEHPFKPLTLYNKYKGMCEPILFKHTDKNFVGVIFRPATICGYSPRQRFDLSVNVLTAHAIINDKILVFGGDQLRPNLHILDYCDLLNLLISIESKKITNEIFNVGYQNLSIIKIAEIVKNVVLKEFPQKKKILIDVKKSNDLRSYHINSDKIKNELGFRPQRTIEDAVKEICDAFKKNKYNSPLENSEYYNVKRIKELNIS